MGSRSPVWEKGFQIAIHCNGLLVGSEAFVYNAGKNKLMCTHENHKDAKHNDGISTQTGFNVLRNNLQQHVRVSRQGRVEDGGCWCPDLGSTRT